MGDVDTGGRGCLRLGDFLNALYVFLLILSRSVLECSALLPFNCQSLVAAPSPHITTTKHIGRPFIIPVAPVCCRDQLENSTKLFPAASPVCCSLCGRHCCYSSLYHYNSRLSSCLC